MSSRAYALSGSNLISFNPLNPAIGTTIGITNVAAGETLVGIDFRPVTGFLYGFGVNATADTATLYVISTQTGFATAVGTFGGAGDLPTDGYGFDFNPAVDRIRVTTASGLNFRLNPNDGTLIPPDTPIAGSAISGAAYTNNQPNNGGITTLYTLDSAGDRLMLSPNPNSGIQVAVGFTGVDFSAVNGFDVPAGVNAAASGSAVSSGSGLAMLTVGGVTGLYSINLVTGAATAVGSFLNGATAVNGLAIHNDLGGIPAFALSADGLNLLRFNTANPGTTTSVTVGAITAGETLVGIDFRPNTGQLFALGVNAAADTGTLYRVDPQNGLVTVVGAAGGVVAGDLPATGYGMDFNPAVDRIRITTDSGLNFRINPDTGVAISPDLAINGLPPGSTGVSAAAYTNNYGQPAGTVSTLYTLDSTSNSLFIQNPANAGTQTGQRVVAVGGIALDFTSVNGFDIPAGVTVASVGAPANGFGYADLTVGGVTSLYRIDLATGAATNLGAIGTGAPLAGLALALAPVTPPVPSDFNGDDRSDILWQNDNGTPGIWTMDGLNRTAGANVGVNPGPTWHVKAAGDFNADDHADILWQNDNGTAGVWLMDGFNVVADNTVGFNPGPSWKVIDAGDFDADGKADILWQNDNGTAGIWTMDGLNRTGGANVGFNPGPSWHVKAAGDFNADGHADILWQNDNGAAGIWLMDGFNVIGDGIVGFNPGPSWKVIDAGDFNGDGRADILWQNENGTPGIWTMDGLIRTGGANVGGFNPGPTWKVKSAGDYNSDGRSDILWQNDNGQPGIWLMDGFNVIADNAVGFNPGPSWHVIGQQDTIG